jgi:hypothetical protein
MNKIYIVRDKKVMLDRDLAELYGVETKYLKRQVRRNAKRFPLDFMFEFTKKELEDWRCNFGTSNGDVMGLRYPPYAFTEQGVAMLSGVINSDRAIIVNIQIMRIFTKMREMLLTRKDLLLKVEQIEGKVTSQDEKIKMLFDYLKKFVASTSTKRRQIGYSKK